MRQACSRSLATVLLFLTAWIAPAHADDQASSVRIQEEISALPLPIPMFAYLVRPVGDGPFPLVIMNHGVSLNPRDRSFFPLVEFRDAAIWFARQGDLVVAPVGSGYGASAIDIAERGLYGPSPMPASRPTSPTESGRTLAVEVVDSNILSVTTSLPVGQFASIRQGAPVQAFDQAIDE